MATTNPGPVVPGRYAEALGELDPFFVLAETPDNVRKAIRGLTEKQLATRPLPGKWSIKEIIAHLADGEVIVGSRLRFVAAQDRPAIPGYDQDAFVANLGVENAKTVELLDDFSLARAVNVGLLLRLPDESLDRVGIHSERGEESILTMLQMYGGHDLHHLSQIQTIRIGLFGLAKASKKAPKKGAKRPAAKKKAAPKVAAKAAAKVAEKAAVKVAPKAASKGGRKAAPKAIEKAARRRHS